MIIKETPIGGLKVIEPDVYCDQRGYFFETWQTLRYLEVCDGLMFVQDNHSKSTRGVLRGLHYQKKYPQGKLVMVSYGSVFDVAVDLREGSPTFAKWYGVELSAENHKQLWIPPGFAHGFVVLSDEAYFHYKCTEFYRPSDEGSIRWNDPSINIEWPINANEIKISSKDSLSPYFEDYIKDNYVR